MAMFVNGFPHRRAHGTIDVLTVVVVMEDEARGHAVSSAAAGILAVGNVGPEKLHLLAEPCGRADFWSMRSSSGAS